MQRFLNAVIMKISAKCHRRRSHRRRSSSTGTNSSHAAICFHNAAAHSVQFLLSDQGCQLCTSRQRADAAACTVALHTVLQHSNIKLRHIFSPQASVCSTPRVAREAHHVAAAGPRRCPRFAVCSAGPHRAAWVSGKRHPAPQLLLPDEAAT